MSFDPAEISLLVGAVRAFDEGFSGLPPTEPAAQSPEVRQVLLETARRLHDNFPYQHPLYVGQMLKPPHPLAWAAYAMAMRLNPNNHALDGGRASSAMEKEAVAALAAMLGWGAHLGHLTGGGTVANLEALWIARELCPGKALVASSQAHYTHARLAGVLGTPFRAVAADVHGRMSLAALERECERGDVGTVVAAIGTTGSGALDPLPGILALRERYGFRLHADAAYGGYFTLAGNLAPGARAVFDSLGEADSVVIDPHKHGLQPYGCGCVLFRNPAVGRAYRHDSPYTYFSSSELHLGEISLECSRPGAAAVALWATQRLLPLVPGGEFALGLERGRDAALALHAALSGHARFAPFGEPELDIVVWAVRARSATESSARARAVFDAAAGLGLHLALATFPRAMVEPSGAIASWDADAVTCLRACVMKPEHAEWMPRILERLGRAAGAALGGGA